MFSIQPDSKEFKQFLDSNASESFDLFFKGDTVRLVSNTEEIFTVFECECSHSAEDKELVTHLPKLPFKKLAADGAMLFDVKNDLIEVSFLRGNGEIFCSTSFNRQEVNDFSYEEKLEIAMDRTPTTSKRFDLATLGTLPKVARSLGGVLIVGTTTATILSSFGCRVYKKLEHESPFSFSVNSKQLTALGAISRTVRGYHEFLIAHNKHLTTIVKQVRGMEDVALEDLMATECYYTANVHLSNVFQFLGHLKIDQPTVELNVESRVCEFTSNSCTYKVPYTVNNEYRPDGCKFRKYTLPVAFVNAILTALPGSTFKLEQHANFILLLQNDYVVEG